MSTNKLISLDSGVYANTFPSYERPLVCSRKKKSYERKTGCAPSNKIIYESDLDIWDLEVIDEPEIWMATAHFTDVCKKEDLWNT
jgi:hypothetical protein